MSDVSCFCVWRETIKWRATSVSYWRKRLRASTSPFSAFRLLQLLHGIQSLVAHFFSDASLSTHIISSPKAASLASLSVSLLFC